MSFQSQVFECSAQNSPIKISNSEWITEFPAGIKLDPGDTVRVLGSFIQEKGGGDEIEIDDDLSMMVEHAPYITSETITLHTSDGDDYQINMGMYAEPPFIVDSFGTEPMSRAITSINTGTPVAPVQNKPNNSDYGTLLLQGPSLYFANQNPADNNNGVGENFYKQFTGSLDFNWEYQDNYNNGQGDIAITAGWNNPTLKRERKRTTAESQGNVVTVKDSDQFLLSNIPREFYISTICKLIEIPIFDGLRYYDPTNTIKTIEYEIDTTGGRSLPFHAGDYIATYFISGYLDPNGVVPNNREYNTQFSIIDDDNPFGKVRYDAGPRSLVGKVLAVIGEDITVPTHESVASAGETGQTGNNVYPTLKMYVWDWVNPGAYKKQNVDKTQPRHGIISDNNYAEYAQSSKINGNVYGASFDNAALQNASYPGYQGKRAYMQYLRIDGNEGPENDPGAFENVLVDYYQTQNMPNSSDEDQLLGTTANSCLNMLWSAKGSSWKPKSYDGNFNTSAYDEVCSSWATQVEETATTDIKNYWLCQPFLVDYTSTQRAQCHTANYERWTNIGAIVRVNITNDNIEPYAVQAGKTHFLGVPVTHQVSASKQKTFTQNNQFGNQWIFGLQCPREDKTTAYSATNRREPFHNGLSDPSNPVGIARDRTKLMPPVGNTNSAQQGTWHLGQTGNTANITPYFQNSTGDCKIDKQDQNLVWNSDLLIIKKHKTELKLPAGFYNVSELATIFNDQLHYSHKDYLQKVGKFTTVGFRERAMASNPTIINGNFLMSFVPDVSYGFIPVTESVSATVGLDVNTSLVTQIQTIAIGTESENALANPQAGNIAVYTAPYNFDSSISTTVNNYGNQNTCFRLIGGKLDNRFTSSLTQQTTFKSRLSNRLYMCTRDFTNGGISGFVANQAYTRTYMNSLSFGGASKIFVGTPNPTFSWDENLQKFYWEFLYCPIRPVETEDDEKGTISGGDAVPSVVINSDGTGAINAEYGGIYITSLTADPITNNNSYDLLDFPDNSYFQFVNATNLQIQEFKDINLGFVEQIGFTNRNWNPIGENPYIFIDNDTIYGNMLRNYPEIDLAINASNPFKSLCTPMQPYNEFFVEVDSDEYLADTTPRLSNTPFYLIGSDLIMAHYHGAKGTKLPVIGICGRNYSRFSYVFDLSESAISYRVEEARTLTSIRTKIYTNGYKEAKNLFPNSAVIYIIQKNNYAPPAPDPVIQQYTQLLAAQQKALANVNYQPIIQQANYPTLYQMPNAYEESDEDE